MYRPLPDGLTIKASKVQGLGLFATQDFEADTVLGIVHIANKNFPHGYIRTALGAFYNHSENPNCIVETKDNLNLIIANVDIMRGEEITVDYREQPYLEQPKEDWV